MSVSIIASGFAGAGVVALHNGKHVVEAFTTYLKPPNGPYEEIHVLDPSPIPQANASFYGSHTETTVTPTCGRTASTFKFTINF